MSERDADVQARREEWLTKTRIEWYRVMRPLGMWVPWNVAEHLTLHESDVPDYFRPAARLDAKHLQHCRLVADRTELLRSCLPKRGVVAEVGTDTGDFAERILMLSAPAELHVMDKTFQNFRRDRFAAAIALGTVRLHEADSVDALRQFSDGHFDWIYIDADHSYEGVRRDLIVAKTKVKRDGLLVLNDYVFWSHREFMAYGVVQAVNELCLTEDWELVCLPLHPEMHSDVVLRKL